MCQMTEEERRTGEWVRELAASSELEWKAFYHTRAWKQKRVAILERDHGMCQRCRARGRYAKAVTVHHIKHLKDVPELALTDSNLQSLCAACHEDMHPERHYGSDGAGFTNEERWLV